MDLLFELVNSFLLCLYLGKGLADYQVFSLIEYLLGFAIKKKRSISVLKTVFLKLLGIFDMLFEFVEDLVWFVDGLLMLMMTVTFPTKESTFGALSELAEVLQVKMMFCAFGEFQSRLNHRESEVA